MFGKVYSKGIFRSSKGVVVYKLKNYDRKKTLLGISVSKKRGNAVVRNRTRRIIKEAYREMYANLKKGFIIVITARQACTSYKSYDVKRELERLFDSLDLFVE
jgi:ribonuclease P protein component